MLTRLSSLFNLTSAVNETEGEFQEKDGVEDE